MPLFCSLSSPLFAPVTLILNSLLGELLLIPFQLGFCCPADNQGKNKGGGNGGSCNASQRRRAEWNAARDDNSDLNGLLLL